MAIQFYLQGYIFIHEQLHAHAVFSYSYTSYEVVATHIAVSGPPNNIAIYIYM